MIIFPILNGPSKGWQEGGGGSHQPVIHDLQLSYMLFGVDWKVLELLDEY